MNYGPIMERLHFHRIPPLFCHPRGARIGDIVFFPASLRKPDSR
jgi:hypothetical protein